MSFLCEDNLPIYVKEVSWLDYLDQTKKMVPYWIFRGQSYGAPTMKCLKSRFERALTSYNIPPSDAPSIEDLMIREFRRKYDGIDSEVVSKDTLYCLSLMQHYGCPTRLLDCTYSPYIAAFFAVENLSIAENAKLTAFVFCFNHKWINESAKENIDDDDLFKKRFDDRTLRDESFTDLYMGKKRKGFIVAENPLQLHKRLSIQKGVFLIQGDISKSMIENITDMNGWQSEGNLFLFKLQIETEKELRKAYEDLRLINITHESLFPGLDGFSKSLKQNLYWFQELPVIKAKLAPFPISRT